MNTSVHGPGDAMASAGPLSLALAVLAVLSFGWIALISASTGFDPPQWLRITGSSMLPLGLAGSVLAGVLGLRTPGRAWAVAGLVVVAVVVAAFAVLYTLMV